MRSTQSPNAAERLMESARGRGSATGTISLTRLNTEVNKALESPELREKLAQQYYDPIGGTPERFAQAIRADMDRYGRAIKEAGIKPE